MGTEQSKPKGKLAEIDREIHSIRSSLRASNGSLSKERKNNIQENLIKYSNEASELKGKVKSRQLDSTQKNISQTMREVLTIDSDLDQAAIETDSIVQVPQNRRSASLEGTKYNIKSKSQSRSMPSLQTVPTLQDIENKLKTLRSQIKVALQSEDTTQLRLHQETLKVLATSLELIEVPEYTPMGDKKKKLDIVVTAQYQKINKSLKEIRRNRDIKYLTQQKQKEDVLKELENLRIDIEKNDSLSRTALRDGNTQIISDVNKNLKDIYHRLSSIETVDDSTDTLKLQMKDKVSWLNKYINEFAKKGSQPDLTKAQANYEDIIKNIASGQSKSRDEFRVKLESLQSFTSSINSTDEEDFRKKKVLLGNINDSLITLNGNQVLKRINTVDMGALERKEIFQQNLLEHFVDSWNMLKNSVLTSDLSSDNISQVDEVLSFIQNSIIETRGALMSRLNLYHQTKSNISVSVPNLVEKATMPNFLSSWTEETNTQLENTNESKTDTSAEMNAESVQLRSKDKLREEEIRFSTINEIKTQVYYIKEKFETSIQKPNLKAKLEVFKKTLEEYIKSDNQVIANSAKILVDDIHNINKEIDNVAEKFEQLPKEYFNDIISRVEENVSKFEKSAKSFQADRNYSGYQDIKQLLLESRDYLETIDIPVEYDKINKQRLKILKKIEQIIEECERESSRREKAYVGEANETLEKLKERINRFSGPYKGVLYNAIEKDLNKILIDADANVTNKLVSDQIIKDTERFLKILEHRATKDQSFRSPRRAEANEKMSALKEELQSIKNDIDATPTTSVKLFVGLNSRLDLIKLSLDQLRNLDENIGHQREIIYNEIETLKNVVEANIALGQDVNQTSLEEFKKRATEDNNKRITQELDKIELTLGKLKADISNFVGTKSDKKYYELDESTLRLIVKIDDLKLGKGTPFYDRTANLLKQIQQYEQLLDVRTMETEHILQFERDITDIENNFSTYTKSVKDLDNLAEKVKILKLNLERSECHTPLRERKKSCIERMNDMENTIRNKTCENILVEEHLIQIRYRLDALKKNIEITETPFIDLKNRLTSIKREVLDMEDLNSGNQEQRSDLLKSLECLEASFTLRELNSQETVVKDDLQCNKDGENKIEREILGIEKQISRLKNEIDHFVGTTKDEKFKELDESINKLIMQLDYMHLNKKTEYYEKKVDLLKDLNHYSELLDKRAEDTENIVQMEQELKDISDDSSKISADYLNRKICELEKCQVIDELIDRKRNCLEHLKQFKNNSFQGALINLLLPYENHLKLVENKVDSFAGVPTDSDFKEIEDNLQKLFAEVQKVELPLTNEYEQKKADLLEQIENTRNFFTNKAKENKIVREFITELEVIKNKINSTADGNSLNELNNKLKSIQTDVEKAPIKEKLKNDVHRICTVLLQSYSVKLNSLPKTNYIGSIDFLKDLERNNNKSKLPFDNFESDLQKLSEVINEINTKVDKFTGTDTDNDYKQLEEELLRINVRVKKLNDLNKSENIKKKQHLKERVVNCLTLLDEKVQYFEDLVEVEQQIQNLEVKINKKSSQNDWDNIDETLISLQVRLGKLKYLNKSCSDRKNKAIEKIVALMKVIKQRSSNSNSEDSGTSI